MEKLPTALEWKIATHLSIVDVARSIAGVCRAWRTRARLRIDGGAGFPPNQVQRERAQVGEVAERRWAAIQVAEARLREARLLYAPAANLYTNLGHALDHDRAERIRRQQLANIEAALEDERRWAALTHSYAFLATTELKDCECLNPVELRCALTTVVHLQLVPCDDRQFAKLSPRATEPFPWMQTPSARAVTGLVDTFFARWGDKVALSLPTAFARSVSRTDARTCAAGAAELDRLRRDVPGLVVDVHNDDVVRHTRWSVSLFKSRPVAAAATPRDASAPV